jgi:uncharacterized protein YjdB
VTVKIVSGNGAVEEVPAVYTAGNRRIYAATQNNSDAATGKITVTDSDLPGNVAESELFL